MSQGEILSETIQKESICKNCSGKLQYAPGTSRMICPYCGTENEITASAEILEELDFEKYIKEFEEKESTEELAVIKCQGCGAQTTFDPNVVSEACPCCGSPLVVKDATTSHAIKPKAILPFGVGQDRANKAFSDWIGKLWFAPDKLKRYARQDSRLTGLYIPYWTYDSHTSTDYRGERGDDYQTTESYSTTENGQSVSKTRTVTRTRWTSVSGHVDKVFDDVLVVASKSLPGEYVEKLEPWDLNNLVPFSSSYLSGFRTESYQIDLREGLDAAKIRMNKAIHAAICRDIGGDHQRVHSANTSWSNITFKHILMPVWISAYSFGNKTYRFLVNGRTGEVQGERPYSWVKITFAVLAAAAVILLIVLLANK